MLRRLFVALALAGAVTATATACKKKEAAPGQGTAVAAQKVPVAIFVDDKQVATEATLGATPTELAGLAPGAPPLDQWIGIEVIDTAGKVHTTLAPAKNKAGEPPALAAGPTFGFVKAGALDGAVAAVAKVTILTRPQAAAGGGRDDGHGHGGGDSGGGGGGGGERPVPTAELTFEVETPKGTSTFTGDKLVPLPSVTAPVGDTETPGWNFLDVMKAAGIADAKVLHLTDSENANLRLEGDDFDPAKTMLYVKVNKSGVIRFRVFRKQGDAWEVGGELRGITKIKVVS